MTEAQKLVTLNCEKLKNFELWLLLPANQRSPMEGVFLKDISDIADALDQLSALIEKLEKETRVKTLTEFRDKYYLPGWTQWPGFLEILAREGVDNQKIKEAL